MKASTATTSLLNQDVTMKAVIQDRYGSSEVLRVDDFAVPEPGDHDVLIKVHAAGLDRGTEHLMTGKPYAAGCRPSGSRCLPARRTGRSAFPQSVPFARRNGSDIRWS